MPRRPGSASKRSPWPIDLAHVRPFRLGDVEVRPASREVVRGDRREVLEPLVMQVLVALASGRREILSRDDLIASCWGGRAITDDALNRVVSRLRALGRTFGTFQVETIVKVGYRMVETGGSELPEAPAIAPPEEQPRGIDRRALVAGGAAVATLAAGAVLWRQPWRHHPPADAVELFGRGEIAQRQGFSGQERQAISFYEQALRIDPLYSAAWGALALANTHLLEGYSDAETEAVPGRLRSAAERSLRLDPGNADAQLALTLIRPTFHNWYDMEGGLRRFVDRHPQHWLGAGRLAVLLFDVGRLDDGIVLMEQVLRIDPMLPVGQAFLANGLLSGGRLQEAETLLNQAREQWPAHPSLWGMTVKYLLFSGKPQSAEAFMADPDSRPSGVGSDDIAPLARLARALEGHQPAAVATSIADFTERARLDIQDMPLSAAVFAMLGRPDLTFAAWERYFFDRGSFGQRAAIRPLTRRYARELFSMPMAPLRSDPRFASLLQRIGLEEYWRHSHSLPDYRRPPER